MKAFITFILSNYSLTFFMIGLTASGISLLRHGSRCDRILAARTFLSGFLLYAIGFSFLYNFIMHVFFAEEAARFIGWANSPFQYEVGYASLGFGVVAILARRSTYEFSLAEIIGPALFLWGAALGHIYQMVTAHNFSPGNAGVVFWTDIFIPVFGLLLLRSAYSHEKR